MTIENIQGDSKKSGISRDKEQSIQASLHTLDSEFATLTDLSELKVSTSSERRRASQALVSDDSDTFQTQKLKSDPSVSTQESMFKGETKLVDSMGAKVAILGEEKLVTLNQNLSIFLSEGTSTNVITITVTRARLVGDTLHLMIKRVSGGEKEITLPPFPRGTSKADSFLSSIKSTRLLEGINRQVKHSTTALGLQDKRQVYEKLYQILKSGLLSDSQKTQSAQSVAEEKGGAVSVASKEVAALTEDDKESVSMLRSVLKRKMGITEDPKLSREYDVSFDQNGLGVSVTRNWKSSFVDRVSQNQLTSIRSDSTLTAKVDKNDNIMVTQHNGRLVMVAEVNRGSEYTDISNMLTMAKRTTQFEELRQYLMNPHNQLSVTQQSKQAFLNMVSDGLGEASLAMSLVGKVDQAVIDRTRLTEIPKPKDPLPPSSNKALMKSRFLSDISFLQDVYQLFPSKLTDSLLSQVPGGKVKKWVFKRLLKNERFSGIMKPFAKEQVAAMMSAYREFYTNLTSQSNRQLTETSKMAKVKTVSKKVGSKVACVIRETISLESVKSAFRSQQAQLRLDLDQLQADFPATVQVAVHQLKEQMKGVTELKQQTFPEGESLAAIVEHFESVETESNNALNQLFQEATNMASMRLKLTGDFETKNQKMVTSMQLFSETLSLFGEVRQGVRDLKSTALADSLEYTLAQPALKDQLESLLMTSQQQDTFLDTMKQFHQALKTDAEESVKQSQATSLHSQLQSFLSVFNEVPSLKSTMSLLKSSLQQYLAPSSDIPEMRHHVAFQKQVVETSTALMTQIQSVQRAHIPSVDMDAVGRLLTRTSKQLLMDLNQPEYTKTLWQQSKTNLMGLLQQIQVQWVRGRQCLQENEASLETMSQMKDSVSLWINSYLGNPPGEVSLTEDEKIHVLDHVSVMSTYYQQADRLNQMLTDAIGKTQNKGRQERLAMVRTLLLQSIDSLSLEKRDELDSFVTRNQTFGNVMMHALFKETPEFMTMFTQFKQVASQIYDRGLTDFKEDLQSKLSVWTGLKNVVVHDVEFTISGSIRLTFQVRGHKQEQALLPNPLGFDSADETETFGSKRLTKSGFQIHYNEFYNDVKDRLAVQRPSDAKLDDTEDVSGDGESKSGRLESESVASLSLDEFLGTAPVVAQTDIESAQKLSQLKSVMAEQLEGLSLVKSVRLDKEKLSFSYDSAALMSSKTKMVELPMSLDMEMLSYVKSPTSMGKKSSQEVFPVRLAKVLHAASNREIQANYLATQLSLLDQVVAKKVTKFQQLSESQPSMDTAMKKLIGWQRDTSAFLTGLQQQHPEFSQAIEETIQQFQTTYLNTAKEVMLSIFDELPAMISFRDQSLSDMTQETVSNVVGELNRFYTQLSDMGAEEVLISDIQKEANDYLVRVNPATTFFLTNVALDDTSMKQLAMVVSVFQEVTSGNSEDALNEIKRQSVLWLDKRDARLQSMIQSLEFSADNSEAFQQLFDEESRINQVRTLMGELPKNNVVKMLAGQFLIKMDQQTERISDTIHEWVLVKEEIELTQRVEDHLTSMLSQEVQFLTQLLPFVSGVTVSEIRQQLAQMSKQLNFLTSGDLLLKERVEVRTAVVNTLLELEQTMISDSPIPIALRQYIVTQSIASVRVIERNIHTFLLQYQFDHGVSPFLSDDGEMSPEAMQFLIQAFSGLFSQQFLFDQEGQMLKIDRFIENSFRVFDDRAVDRFKKSVQRLSLHPEDHDWMTKNLPGVEVQLNQALQTYVVIQESVSNQQSLTDEQQARWKDAIKLVKTHEQNLKKAYVDILSEMSDNPSTAYQQTMTAPLKTRLDQASTLLAQMSQLVMSFPQLTPDTVASEDASMAMSQTDEGKSEDIVVDTISEQSDVVATDEVGDDQFSLELARLSQKLASAIQQSNYKSRTKRLVQTQQYLSQLLVGDQKGMGVLEDYIQANKTVKKGFRSHQVFKQIPDFEEQLAQLKAHYF